MMGFSGRRSLVTALLACMVAMPLSAQRTASGPAVTPTAQPPIVRAPGVTPYRINPGDEIEVYVWGEERLQRQIRVLPDGTIAMPLVGQLSVRDCCPNRCRTQSRSAWLPNIATRCRRSRYQ